MEETGKQLKCLGCGGPLEFDPVSQKMKCSYCGTEVEVEETTLEENVEETKEAEGDFRVITCNNCGAELLTDEYTTAAFCSYCGSPSIVESRIKGARMPDYVLPFQVDKKQALEDYHKWTKKGFLTPKVFKTSAVMEKITGIYVPFWLYDYCCDLHADGECVKIRYSSDSQNNYIHRDYFYVCRDIEARFEKIPADASEKMEDGMMDKLEPFDYEELKPFTMAYLSGYLSERYNMAAAALEDRVENRVDRYMEEILAQETAIYSERHLRKEMNNQIDNVSYVLLPVWLLNYRYKEKNYSFAVNGQTGKIAADLPISKAKACGVFLVASVLMYLLVFVVGGLISPEANYLIYGVVALAAAGAITAGIAAGNKSQMTAGSSTYGKEIQVDASTKRDRFMRTITTAAPKPKEKD